MTLKEAAAQGIERVFKPSWADPHDYVKIDLVRAGPDMSPLGPWAHLYSSLLKHLGMECPQHMFAFQDRDTDWEAYTGPSLGLLPPSAEPAP